MNPAEAVETKRKSRRVSLLFNGRKTSAQSKKECPTTDPLPQQNKSKHHHRRKVHRRHSDGNLHSHRGSHESGLAFGRCSSRESSISLKSQKSQKVRKSSKGKANSASVGKIPWFGCWGNECMY